MEHRKWLKRKLRDNQPRIRLEGNKGGNFVELIPMKNDRVYLHSGCGCVVTIDAVVPNEFLSILLRDCILDYGSVKDTLKQPITMKITGVSLSTGLVTGQTKGVGYGSKKA